MGNTQRIGKYNVVTNAEKPLTYLDAGADFIINKESEKLDADYVPAYNDVEKTTTTWIEFFEEDGTTPLSMTVARSRKDELPSGYLDDTPENIVAYADNKLHNVDLKGRSVRTLSHSPSINFTKDDEAPIEKYKMMLAELPEGAAEGKKVQDYYIVITQNSFSSYITGTEVLGSYTLSGNTYTLRDEFNETAFGALTITVGTDGSVTGATYTNDGNTIELVPFKVAGAESILQLGSTVEVRPGLSMPCTLDFMSNCTFKLVVPGGTTNIEISGKWTLAFEGPLPNITFKDVTKGSVSYAFGSQITFTWTGDLTDSLTDKTIVFTAEQAALKPLQSAVPDVEQVLELTTEKEIKSGLNAECKLAFFSDKTVKMTVSLMGSSIESTANWALEMSGVPNFTFTDANGGTFSFVYAAGTGTFTWNGDLGSIKDVTIDFSTPASGLAPLGKV